MNIDKRKNKCSARQENWSDFHSIPLKKLMGIAIQALPLRATVERLGGIDTIREQCKWQLVRQELKIAATTSSGFQLNRAYKAYWERESEEEEEEEKEESEEEGSSGDEEGNDDDGDVQENDEEEEEEEEDSEEEYSDEDKVKELTQFNHFLLIDDDIRTATCTPKNENETLQPLPHLKVIAPPKVSWKQGLHVKKISNPAAAALDILEHQKSSIHVVHVHNKRVTEAEAAVDDDNQPAWRASKKHRGAGWGLVL